MSKYIVKPFSTPKSSLETTSLHDLSRLRAIPLSPLSLSKWPLRIQISRVPVLLVLKGARSRNFRQFQHLSNGHRIN